jgi:hypothetical protein
VEDLQTVKFENEQLRAKITNANTFTQQRAEEIGELSSFENREEGRQNLNIHNTSSFANQAASGQEPLPSELPSHQTSNFNYSRSRNNTNKSNSHACEESSPEV